MSAPSTTKQKKRGSISMHISTLKKSKTNKKIQINENWSATTKNHNFPLPKYKQTKLTKLTNQTRQIEQKRTNNKVNNNHDHPSTSTFSCEKHQLDTLMKKSWSNV